MADPNHVQQGQSQPSRKTSPDDKTVLDEILDRLYALEARLTELEQTEEIHDLGWEWAHPEFDEELDGSGKRRRRRID